MSAMPRLQAARQRRAMGLLELRNEGAFVGDRPLDLVAVVPVVGKRGVDVGEGERRVLVDDLVGRLAELLVPNGHVLDTDAVAGDARFRTTSAVYNLDVFRDLSNQGSGLSARPVEGDG